MGEGEPGRRQHPRAADRDHGSAEGGRKGSPGGEAFMGSHTDSESSSWFVCLTGREADQPVGLWPRVRGVDNQALLD